MQNIWWKSDQQIFTSYQGDVCFDLMVGNRFKHAKDHMLVGYFMRIGVVPDMGTSPRLSYRLSDIQMGSTIYWNPWYVIYLTA